MRQAQAAAAQKKADAVAQAEANVESQIKAEES